MLALLGVRPPALPRGGSPLVQGHLWRVSVLISKDELCRQRMQTKTRARIQTRSREEPVKPADGEKDAPPQERHSQPPFTCSVPAGFDYWALGLLSVIYVLPPPGTSLYLPINTTRFLTSRHIRVFGLMDPGPAPVFLTPPLIGTGLQQAQHQHHSSADKTS